MAHRSGQQPPTRPNQMPEMRRANTALDAATLQQLAEANGPSRELDDQQIQAARYEPPVPPSMGTSTLAPHPSHRPYYQRPPPGRSLPTIPGTPANELSTFNLGVQQRSPSPSSQHSNGEVTRKPVPYH